MPNDNILHPTSAVRARQPWFPSGRPGVGALPEHAAHTGLGTWWTDHPLRPRAAAVSCAGYAVLAGDPCATVPGDLAHLAYCYAVAPDSFLPVLGSAFVGIVPWERMIWAYRDPVPIARPAPAVTVRPLALADAPAVRALGPDLAWIAESWGGPAGLAASGRGWGTFRDGRLLSLACTFFAGSRHEDVAVATLPEERGQGVGSACLRALCRDIITRGRIPSWTCSRDNHPSRRLASKSGFQLIHTYVHYALGAPVTGSRPLAEAARP
ncbi:GNAT family N-acetyltransferase [Streptomyces sp. NPDC049555]|uniref:GNAT family N-acetyltransferase n=1 Tax=Streptomyces sp. NPDC049555 TaxID=3154930 RepID=UPI00342629E3